MQNESYNWFARLAGMTVIGFCLVNTAWSKDWLLDGKSYRSKVVVEEGKHEIRLTNGLIERRFKLAPNAATIGLNWVTTGETLLRAVRPEARVEIDGVAYEVGGLRGQPNHAFLLKEWIDQLESNPEAFQFVGFTQGDPEARMEWKQVRHHASDAVWPPRGVHLAMRYRLPAREGLELTVHYELYDGIPCLSKWLTVENGTGKALRLNRFTSEVLAAVEYASRVEERGVFYPRPNIHVETDYAFQGMDVDTVTKHTVHWGSDPEYSSQVQYLRETPCLLEVRPEVGPNVWIQPGETFTTFRAFIMPYDSTDRERKGLALRKMYRTIAPWTTENPLMMHARFADWDRVKVAIDQCAEVGFEMVILTFGSGFNIEDESGEYLKKMTEYAQYAQAKGVEIGGYSLLSSRRIGDGQDVVSPEGQSPVHGNCPCLQSEWGWDYFRKLYQFYQKTGFRLLEHDGSYPGDFCIATHHPGHEGLEDSQWQQWKRISTFYSWCREQGIYLNVPDYYYLAGANKCGMGYREVNWSLPRAQQVFHTRQNIFDGTWEKLPSMGWMFVPLTEYHGGGEAATIEPLDKHLDHYERMMLSNLAMGVQACYRGPRLYDTERTRLRVKGAVDWFKQYRGILESDLIHGRRADGQDVDWMLHVNPGLKEKGMLVVFNPLDIAVERDLKVNLYYTGIENRTRVREKGGDGYPLTLGRDYTVTLRVRLEPEGMGWFVFEDAE